MDSITKKICLCSIIKMIKKIFFAVIHRSSLTHYIYPMHSFSELLQQFEVFFNKHHFPTKPSTLYEPCSYLLSMGGKRVRPVLCLMSHELFAPLNDNVWNTATAIELFHNFTLMHDDIMDAAPFRRGFETVHLKYGLSTAILSGDVMNIYSYVHLNKIQTSDIHTVLTLFNQTAIQICEGQQMDMDFESKSYVHMEEYIEMITLKTSVLLAASLKLGAILGGATVGCSELLYDFGKTLGIAFQLKDDYLDTFGDPTKTGKQVGGDILANKKTYLMTKLVELADEQQSQQIQELAIRNDEQKVADTIQLMKSMGVDELLKAEIVYYSSQAYDFLERVPVISSRKLHLQAVADMLLKRDY